MSAKNYNEGKTRWALIHKDTPNAMESLARLAEKGCVKYDRLNWSKSIGTDDAPRFKEENLESIMRHVIELMKGNEIDVESGEHHGACIMRRASFCIEYYYAKDDSDRLAEILSEDKPKKSRYDWSTANENDICALTWNDGRVSFLNQWPHRMDLVSHIEARPE